MRLLDPDGAEVTAGEVGEIVVRSPMVMAGYWRDPALTATVLGPEGWLHTGDLARADADGNLRIVGRLKEMYIRGGYNVYPAEIEGYINEMPGVAESALVGVPHPDFGEVGVAIVIAKPGVSLDGDKIITPCRDAKTGVDIYISTSSAGGGLQMMVTGVVQNMTGESAQRAALGAGAIVIDVLASNDGRLPHEKIERIRTMRPDMILMSGGTDGGAVNPIAMCLRLSLTSVFSGANS